MDASGEDLTHLALAAQRGDSASAEALIRHVRPAVLRYVLARGMAEHDADDLAQDVCLAVLQAVARFRDEGRPVWAVVFAIVRNKMADRRRRSARQPEALCGDMRLHEGADDRDQPAELLDQAESAAEVTRLLNGLPPTQRDVLLLRVMVGLSCAETAEALGLTAGSVRVIQYRGMTTLRGRLCDAAAVAS